MDIAFAKLSGSGNDFVCIDNRDGRFDSMLSDELHVAHFARTLCRRGLGVGADGVIFACKPQIDGVADIGALFFETDGSQAELCGNGTACFVHWMTSTGSLRDGAEAKILTPAGVVLGSNSTGQYTQVCIPDPEYIQTDLELLVGGKQWKCDLAIVGTPHAVIYVEDLDSFEVAHWGPLFRHHERFQPRGANANFVEILDEGLIAVRTFEFGVEGETLSCGTGSAAAAIMTAGREDQRSEYDCLEHPFGVRARSGDVLKICFTQHDDGRFTDVCLQTVVRFVYTGVLTGRAAQSALNPACEPAKDAAIRRAVVKDEQS